VIKSAISGQQSAFSRETLALAGGWQNGNSRGKKVFSISAIRVHQR
jgi:hypothetical protein